MCKTIDPKIKTEKYKRLVFFCMSICILSHSLYKKLPLARKTFYIVATTEFILIQWEWEWHGLIENVGKWLLPLWVASSVRDRVLCGAALNSTSSSQPGELCKPGKQILSYTLLLLTKSPPKQKIEIVFIISAHFKYFCIMFYQIV